MNRRLFIECYLIDFAKQATGIPRVVTNYINIGYEWALKNDVEVYPVVLSEVGAKLVDPAPGFNPPSYLTKTLAKRKKRSLHASPTIELTAGDILFCPAYWHDIPAERFFELKEDNVEIVTLVHDILPITHYKYYNYPWRFEVFQKNFIGALGYSNRICTVSKYTKDSILDFCDRNGIQAPEIQVSYNGFDPLVSPSLSEKIKSNDYKFIIGNADIINLLKNENAFMMVGSIEPKKGHIPVIDAFEILWERGFQKPLVIIGRNGWMSDKIVEKIINSRFYGSKLYWSDSFDDLELFAAYVNSSALIFSSIAEGFGLPMIEASSVGTPVVALDTRISREILGDYGKYYSNLPEFLNLLLHFGSNLVRLQPRIWPTWREYTPRVFDYIYRNKKIDNSWHDMNE